MPWWNFGRSKKEIVTASYIGGKFAEMFDPTPQMLSMVKDWHHLSADNLKPFLALASLRAVGFRVGSNQESTVSRVDQKIIIAIYHSFVGALIAKHVDHA